MPDRDPALEAAVNAAIRDDARIDGGVCVEHFKDGYHAALRSLGAGTPAAVAALRELVKAIQFWKVEGDKQVVDKYDVGSNDEATGEAALKMMDATSVFARLATPTEEGR